MLNLEIGDLSSGEFNEALFLSFGFEPDAMDLMTMTPAMNFDKAYNRAKKIDIDKAEIKLASIDDLIWNKESLKRTGGKEHLDQFNLHQLKKIRLANPGT